jgi:biopolymer transport protein ExbB/TolQ
MAWTIALDLLLAGLLVATIVVGVLLNRRLAEMRRHRAELETLGRAFDDATRRAEDGIGRLKVSSDALQQHLGEATTAADDLRFLIERAKTLADRLEADVRAARGRTEPTVPAPAVRKSPTLPTAAPTGRKPRSQTEQELLQALGMNELSP